MWQIFKIGLGPWRSRFILFVIWKCRFLLKHIFHFPVCIGQKNLAIFLRIGNTHRIVQCASPSKKTIVLKFFCLLLFTHNWFEWMWILFTERSSYVNILMDNTPPASSGNRDWIWCVYNSKFIFRWFFVGVGAVSPNRARSFGASIYWCSIKKMYMFAASSLFF